MLLVCRVHPFAGLGSWTSLPSSLFSDRPTSQPLWGWPSQLCSRQPGPVHSPRRQLVQLRLPAWLCRRRAPVHRWVTVGGLSDPERCFGCTSPGPLRSLSLPLTHTAVELPKEKEKVSFESEREAEGDCPGTRLLSMYGGPWKSRAWSSGETLPACSLLFPGASEARRDVGKGIYPPGRKSQSFNLSG